MVLHECGYILCNNVDAWDSNVWIFFFSCWQWYLQGLEFPQVLCGRKVRGREVRGREVRRREGVRGVRGREVRGREVRGREGGWREGGR